MAEVGDLVDWSTTAAELALRKSFVRRRLLISPISLHLASTFCAAVTKAGLPSDFDEGLGVEARFRRSRCAGGLASVALELEELKEWLVRDLKRRSDLIHC